jgi:hypothetical protein
MEALSATEKPLSPGAKAALMFGAGVVILFYYLTVLVMMVLLAALLLCELALLVLIIQLGGPILLIMHQHRDLFMIFLRSLWLAEQPLRQWCNDVRNRLGIGRLSFFDGGGGRRGTVSRPANGAPTRARGLAWDRSRRASHW